MCANGINLFGYQWIDESKPAIVPSKQPPPRPHIFTPGKCNDSDQCDKGRNMCNFDDEEGGFCENCAHFMSPDACQMTGFITSRGFDNCIEYCNGGSNPNGIQWIDERALEKKPSFPGEHIFTPGTCTDSFQCDNGENMCNFDDGDHGFCENCAHFKSAEACQGTGFITGSGFDNCIKHCAGGKNPNGLKWIDERSMAPVNVPNVHIFTPGNCKDSSDCDDGKNMCNFDSGSFGFCENCDDFRTAKFCQMTGFITKAGFDNCIKHCAGDFNPDRLQWIDEGRS